MKRKAPEREGGQKQQANTASIPTSGNNLAMMTDKELLERALVEVAPLNPTAGELVRRFAEDLAAEDAYEADCRERLSPARVLERLTHEVKAQIEARSPESEAFAAGAEGTVRAIVLRLACRNHTLGNALSCDQMEVLVSVGRMVAANVDPRPQYCYPETVGRPATTPSEWIALDVLLRGETKANRGVVADRWHLKEETVRGIARNWRSRAQHLLELFGEDGARTAVSECHRLHMQEPGMGLITAATLGDPGAVDVLRKLIDR